MNFSKVFFGLAACLLAASQSGCIVTSSSPPPPAGVGSISVDVTIGNSTDPAACDLVAVTDIEVSLFDAGGLLKTVTTDCENFGLTFDGLPEGGYDVQVLLLDFDGHQVSDTATAPADVIANTEVHVPIDFEIVP